MSKKQNQLKKGNNKTKVEISSTETQTNKQTKTQYKLSMKPGTGSLKKIMSL